MCGKRLYSILISQPTSYTDATTAFADGLAYVSGDGKVIMKGDNTTTLAPGVNRNRHVALYSRLYCSYFGILTAFCSVRVTSQAQYNTGRSFISELHVYNLSTVRILEGLFILDVDQAPWGCGKGFPRIVFMKRLIDYQS